MRIIWTDEPLHDLAHILFYYYEHAGPVTPEAVETRTVSQIEARQAFPKRIRESERVADAREFVINRLPYIAFIRIIPNGLLVLNVVHTAREFPG